MLNFEQKHRAERRAERRSRSTEQNNSTYERPRDHRQFKPCSGSSIHISILCYVQKAPKTGKSATNHKRLNCAAASRDSHVPRRLWVRPHRIEITSPAQYSHHETKQHNPDYRNPYKTANTQPRRCIELAQPRRKLIGIHLGPTRNHHLQATINGKCRQRGNDSRHTGKANHDTIYPPHNDANENMSQNSDNYAANPPPLD